MSNESKKTSFALGVNLGNRNTGNQSVIYYMLKELQNNEKKRKIN